MKQRIGAGECDRRECLGLVRDDIDLSLPGIVPFESQLDPARACIEFEGIGCFAQLYIIDPDACAGWFRRD